MFLCVLLDWFCVLFFLTRRSKRLNFVEFGRQAMYPGIKVKGSTLYYSQKANNNMKGSGPTVI